MVAGHTRLKALRAILAKEPDFVPKGAPGPGLARVVFHEFDSEAEADLYALADNKLGELAEWDDLLLAGVVAAMAREDVELTSGTGFEQHELEALLSEPDFDPASADEQSQLDVAAKVTCPSCGHEFAPKA